MVHPIEPLPADVVDALARGDKLEAIKRLRAATGLGLADAKLRIDQRPMESASTRVGVRADVPAAVLAALQGGRWIEAIKLLRAHSGAGLKEARDLIDAQRRGAGAPPSATSSATSSAPPDGLSPGEVPRNEGLGLMLAVVAAAVVGYLVFFR